MTLVKVDFTKKVLNCLLDSNKRIDGNSLATFKKVLKTLPWFKTVINLGVNTKGNVVYYFETVSGNTFLYLEFLPFEKVSYAYNFDVEEVSETLQQGVIDIEHLQAFLLQLNLKFSKLRNKLVA